jgi:gluconokinase
VTGHPNTSTATAIVLMGVSGSGKTTIAQLLAARLGWVFIEADDLHPAANIEKMAHGIELQDSDRWPWLRRISERLDECADRGEDAALTCSALKRSYRDVVHLSGSPELIAARMAHRSGHFMPTSLLASQLATLEALGPDEDGFVVSIEGEPAETVERIVSYITGKPNLI